MNLREALTEAYRRGYADRRKEQDFDPSYILDLLDEVGDWEPTKWHRLVKPDGEMYMETSDVDDITYELSGEAYRDALNDSAYVVVEPAPEVLIHQRLMQTKTESKWVDVKE